MSIKRFFHFIIKPLEYHCYFLAVAMIALLYLQIVISPAGILSLIAASSFFFLSFEIARYVVGLACLVGLIIGVIWAEKIRKTIGVLTFHAYLLSTPEIDGWREHGVRVVKR
ncbi:hypothetical protein [Shewanella marina]|uniref:hypothetical protein n=1 Tax=Shewanella marina TaxID=487319 RepID=UPI00046F8865|nr:hypothetical protein [Shewanella marina]